MFPEEQVIDSYSSICEEGSNKFFLDIICFLKVVANQILVYIPVSKLLIVFQKKRNFLLSQIYLNVSAEKLKH